MISSEQMTTEDMPCKKITVAQIQFVMTAGETVVYVKDTENGVYKQNFAENENLILLNAGDEITVYYEESEAVIKEMISFK